MLIGYVSDERYLALCDVALEFLNDSGSIEARSRASGAVHADLEPGEYTVCLQKPGFGQKRVTMTVTKGEPYHFRLLSEKLLGYMWPKWVQSGEQSEFRCHSTTPYKLELFRYGRDRELIKPIGWFDEHGPRAVTQITPDGDYTRTGVEWNKHGFISNVHAQMLTAPERSGLYYLHARNEGGEFFCFPWIVAPANPTARAAVLMCNITWNAYNNFGGRSNYIHADQMPAVPTVNARLELQRYTDSEHHAYAVTEYAALSFDRPEPISHINPDSAVDGPIEGRLASANAPVEWRLLSWLEREGIAHDVYGETQLHEGVLNLDDYNVLITGAHPEYWSRDMYLTLKDWVFKRGGKLMYLGGNGLNCEVEFLDRHTMTVRNEVCVGTTPPGTESRMHKRLESEANLLGVVYTDTGAMTGAPYRVVDADHWVFEGTGLGEGDIFGEKSQHMRCHGGASGHETDKVSEYSPKNVHLLAKGLNVDDGGAEMIIHEPEGGGAVFSAASINWLSSLLVDEHVSRITANVVKRYTA
jgi:hypothetical protein